MARSELLKGVCIGVIWVCIESLIKGLPGCIQAALTIAQIMTKILPQTSHMTAAYYAPQT